MIFKKIWVQIIAWGICAVIGYRIYYTVCEDHRIEAERNLQLQIQATEAEESNNDKVEKQTDIYDKFYSQLDVNSIVCWGDSAMAGSSSRSLPNALKKVVQENLFSSLEKTFSRVFEQEEYSLPSVSVHNMGVINELMRQILVRSGVNTIEIGERIQIPSGTDPVTLRLMDDEAWSKVSDKNKDEQLKFANQKNVSFGKVWIDGVRGSLVTTDNWFDSNHPQYAFVRKEEGDSQWVDSGTEIEIESATKYLGDIPVFFFENDSGRSVEGLVSDIGQMVDRYAGIDDNKEESSGTNNSNTENVQITEQLQSSFSYAPYVVICTTMEASDLDIALKKKFGDRYIRNDGYSNEMTDRMYRKLAQQVYENLDSQGCFADIHTQINMAVQEAQGF